MKLKISSCLLDDIVTRAMSVIPSRSSMVEHLCVKLVADTKLHAIATDGAQLVRISCPAQVAVPGSVLVKPKDVLTALVGPDTGPVDMNVEKGKLSIVYNGTIRIPTIDGDIHYEEREIADMVIPLTPRDLKSLSITSNFISANVIDTVIFAIGDGEKMYASTALNACWFTSVVKECSHEFDFALLTSHLSKSYKAAPSPILTLGEKRCIISGSGNGIETTCNFTTVNQPTIDIYHKFRQEVLTTIVPDRRALETAITKAVYYTGHEGAVALSMQNGSLIVESVNGTFFSTTVDAEGDDIELVANAKMFLGCIKDLGDDYTIDVMNGVLPFADINNGTVHHFIAPMARRR